MVSICRRIAAHPAFQNAVIVLILLNAIVIGMETSVSLMQRWGAAFHLLNVVFQVFFVTEIVVRLMASSPRVGSFFKDGWNVFDFMVVGLSLIPAIGPLTTIARVARLLRVARLVRYSAELRLIISTMLRSIPSIGHIALLMGILIYVYAVAGVHFFSQIDPGKWGNLGRAALTLFEVITLEGWIDFQDRVIAQVPLAWLFFASFIVIAVFVMVNLLVAVVINNMESVKAEIAPTDEHAALRNQIKALRSHLDDLENRLPK
jgi:voltage-gated sodium channel